MAEILALVPLLSGGADFNMSDEDFLKFGIRSWKFSLAECFIICWCRAKMLQCEQGFYGFTEI